jgi:hypothetical protein
LSLYSKLYKISNNLTLKGKKILKHKVLESIPRKFTKSMNMCFAKPICNNELHMVAKSMVMNKMLAPMAIEFYTFF